MCFKFLLCRRGGLLKIYLNFKYEQVQKGARIFLRNTLLKYVKVFWNFRSTRRARKEKQHQMPSLHDEKTMRCWHCLCMKIARLHLRYLYSSLPDVGPFLQGKDIDCLSIVSSLFVSWPLRLDCHHRNVRVVDFHVSSSGLAAFHPKSLATLILRQRSLIENAGRDIKAEQKESARYPGGKCFIYFLVIKYNTSTRCVDV